MNRKYNTAKEIVNRLEPKPKVTLTWLDIESRRRMEMTQSLLWLTPMSELLERYSKKE